MNSQKFGSLRQRRLRLAEHAAQTLNQSSSKVLAQNTQGSNHQDPRTRARLLQNTEEDKQEGHELLTEKDRTRTIARLGSGIESLPAMRKALEETSVPELGRFTWKMANWPAQMSSMIKKSVSLPWWHI
jgi:hypothetical protein